MTEIKSSIKLKFNEGSILYASPVEGSNCKTTQTSAEAFLNSVRDYVVCLLFEGAWKGRLQRSLFLFSLAVSFHLLTVFFFFIWKKNRLNRVRLEHLKA